MFVDKYAVILFLSCSVSVLFKSCSVKHSGLCVGMKGTIQNKVEQMDQPD